MSDLTITAPEETIDEVVEVNESNNFVTPYQCAGIVNEWLIVHNIKDEDSESGFKTLAPQMFYNYTKKGYIETTLIEGRPYVNVEDLKNWYVAYVTKPKGRKTTKKSFEAPKLPELATTN